MSDIDPTRRHEPLDSDDELTADAYAATVPSRLSGFRGTNPAVLILAAGIAFGIVVLSLVTFLHRASPNRNVAVASASAEPAAPGIGGINGGGETPFVPPAQATYVPQQQPFRLVPMLRPAAEPRSRVTFVPARPAPMAPDRSQTQPQVQAASTTSNDTGGSTMQLEQPKSTGPAGEDAQGRQDLAEQGDGPTAYVPVYKNGKITAMVPTVQSTAGTVPPPVAAQAASSTVAPSSQFISTATAPTTDAPTNQRHFAEEQQSRAVGYVRPQSAMQLDAATVMNARLLTKIESDLPGPVIAQVTQPVYDSATHTTVVVPSGAKLFGTYDNGVVANQTRLLMAFQRLIFPDGREFDIAGQPGAGVGGSAGFGGDVDKHRGTLYTSAALLTILGGAQAALSPQTGNVYAGPNIASQTQAVAGAELAQLGDKIINQALDRRATIVVRPPYGFQVIVTRDLPLDEYVSQHP